MTITMASLDEFTKAYLECAIWSSTYTVETEDGREITEPMDGLYTADDIAEGTLAVMVKDCRAFQDCFGGCIAHDLSRAGHDFWLTRNGHGAGFWDGDWNEPYTYSDQYRTVGDFLTAMSKSYGSFDLYIGDDSCIHGQ